MRAWPGSVGEYMNYYLQLDAQGARIVLMALEFELALYLEALWDTALRATMMTLGFVLFVSAIAALQALARAVFAAEDDFSRGDDE